MSKSRDILASCSAMFLLIGLYFIAPWIAGPESLSKAAATMRVAEVAYVSSRTPAAKFSFDDGTTERPSCGRLGRLCAQLEASGKRRLFVWSTPALLGDPAWIVAVESESRILLSEGEQRETYASFRSTRAFLAGGAIVYSLVFFALLVVGLRRGVWKET